MELNIAYGSTVGSTHRKLNYNNQDAVLVKETAYGTIAMVADGCGSGANSEVGAQLGLCYLSERIANALQQQENWEAVLEQDFKNYTKQLIALHSQKTTDFIRNYGLFTIVAVVITAQKSTLFYAGDGLFVLDNELTIINQANRPKYINNSFLEEEGGDFKFIDISTIQKILIGTDGCEDLGMLMRQEQIGIYKCWADLWEDPELFTNPIKLPKLLMQEAQKGNLRDDTSLIILEHAK